MADFCISVTLSCWKLVNFLQHKIMKLFCIFLAAVYKMASSWINRGRSIKCIHSFAVVLKTDIVYIEKRGGILLGLSCKYPVTLAVLSVGIWGGGDVYQKISTLLMENLNRGQAIVLTPAIFTKKAAQAIGFSRGFEAYWCNHILRLFVKLLSKLRHAEEVAAVIKFPVIRHKCLYYKRIFSAFRLYELAILSCK